MARRAEGPQAGHRALPDEVAAQIQSRIFDGTLHPGDRLPPERELASQLHVNRSSVREALKKLEQLRLVDVQQGSGTRVLDSQHASFDVIFSMLGSDARPNLPLIRELLETYEALAPGMLRLAIDRAQTGDLEAASAQLRSAAEAEVPHDRFVEALRGLGVLLARLSGNRVLLLLANSLYRFLAEHGLTNHHPVAPRARYTLRALLLRMAIALQARDQRVGERTLREIIRCQSEAVLLRLAPEEPRAERLPAPPG